MKVAVACSLERDLSCLQYSVKEQNLVVLAWIQTCVIVTCY